MTEEQTRLGHSLSQGRVPELTHLLKQPQWWARGCQGRRKGPVGDPREDRGATDSVAAVCTISSEQARNKTR